MLERRRHARKNLKALLFCPLIFGLSGVGASCFADMSAFVTTTQSLEQRPAGSSTHTVLDDLSGAAHPYSLTLFSLVSGPTVSNLNSEPLEGYSRHGKRVFQPTGYGVRQEATLGYHLSEEYVLGPVIDFNESFFGANANKIMFGDVQLKLTRLNAVETKLGNNDFKMHWMLGAVAPTAENAHELHLEGGISETLIGRLSFQNSRFSMGGTVGAHTSFYHQGPWVALTKLSSGIETSYHHSGTLSSFVMTSVGDTLGPNIDMTTRTNLFGEMPSHILGMTIGLRIKAADFISLSPLVNWFTDGPLSNATIGLTTSIQLI